MVAGSQIRFLFIYAVICATNCGVIIGNVCLEVITNFYF